MRDSTHVAVKQHIWAWRRKWGVGAGDVHPFRTVRKIQLFATETPKIIHAWVREIM